MECLSELKGVSPDFEEVLKTLYDVMQILM